VTTKVKRKVEVEIEFTPHELARIFIRFNKREQAEFFNGLASQDSFHELSDAQFTDVCEDSELTRSAREIMQKIGKHCGLSEEPKPMTIDWSYYTSGSSPRVPHVCPKCSGSGSCIASHTYKEPSTAEPGGYEMIHGPCETCAGTGVVWDEGGDINK
jgi:hypothetical protein